MVNTPIPHSLKSEAKKAAKILRDFTVPNAKTGPDKLIPAGLILKASGLAILTVVKAGFLVTARGGSGIVIAKLEDGSWSAPSALGIAGLGGGFEIGAEVTDFVIILNKRSAVEAFSKGGNLTLGGNFTIAAGPLGRNIEGDVAVRSPAAIYTYSKTKGLFAGISVEGSGLIERKDANKKFYGRDIRAHEILQGTVEPPADCQELYHVLEHHKEMAAKAALHMAKNYAKKEGKKAMEGRGITSRLRNLSFRKNKSPPKSPKRSSESSYQDTSSDEEYSPPRRSYAAPTSYSPPAMKHSKSSSSAGRSQSMKHTTLTKTTVTSITHKTKFTGTSNPADLVDWDTRPKCQALWAYTAQMPCDLTFREGDVIEILTRTDTDNDWWEGIIGGKTGIFPANYTKLIS